MNDNEKRVKTFVEVMREHFDWRLMSRDGNPSSGVSYAYNYVDDLGVNISILPDSKEFSFSFMVDAVFVLRTPGNMSPYDYDDGKFFMKNYKRFRKAAIHNKEV